MSDKTKTAMAVEFELNWSSGSSAKGALSVDDKIAIAATRATTRGTNKEILKKALGDRYDKMPEYFRKYPGTVTHQVKSFLITQAKRASEIENYKDDEIISQLVEKGVLRPKK